MCEPSLALSVVIPVRDGGADFVTCLAALRASTASVPWELVVADDGSGDDSAARARQGGARVVATPVPGRGPAVARNLGARAARGEVLLFLDADVAVTPGTIATVVAAFHHDPSLAALFGSYDARPAAANFLSQYKNLFHHFVHQTSRAEAVTFWTGCGAVRRTAFFDVGGFSTAFDRPAIEDIEFGLRLTRAGHVVRLCHELQVTHLKRWTARSLVLTDIRDRGIPWVQLLLRERALTLDLNLQATGIASVVCVWLLWAALPAALWWPAAGAMVLGAALLLLGLNLPLYRFFWRERGVPFAVAALPWHWLYCTYSGLCVVFGVLAHMRSSRAVAERVIAESRPQEI